MKQFFLSIIVVLVSISAIAQSPIEHFEPLNWWTGMVNNEVEIMVHGDNIAALTPKIKYKGVKITGQTTYKNPNYLFINVTISAKAKPGTVVFDFYKNKEKVASRNWQLLARQPNQAALRGFDQSDVLYLITPDRFANGDVRNDDIKGMREQADRANKGGRHGGDIQGIYNSLDYISDMGFTAIWLNPLLENDMEEYSYHGYSTTDFYKVDPRFGTNEAYQKLSKTAREKGIKLIMDMIVNHCGSYHWWMEDMPSDNWINQWDSYTGTSHRKTVLQDPYVSDSDKKQFTDGWFVPTMPDLNQRNPQMANYLIQNAIWWIEYLGLAGIRMDTYPYPDEGFMTEWTRRVMIEYPNFDVVGEEWFNEPTIVSYWQKGKNNPNGYTSYLTSLMDFPTQIKIVEALTKEESWSDGLIDLYESIAHDFLYPDPNKLVVFPDNHDMERMYGQVGEDYELFQMAMTYILTTRGIPQVYYGTEILMGEKGQGDHGIIRSDFPGGWRGDTVDAFTGKGLTEAEQAAKDWVKQFLNWRKTATALHNGQMKHFVPQDGVYVYFRYNANQRIMVVMNKNKAATSLKLDRFAEVTKGAKSFRNVMTNESQLNTGSIQVAGKTAVVLEF